MLLNSLLLMSLVSGSAFCQDSGIVQGSQNGQVLGTGVGEARSLPLRLEDVIRLAMENAPAVRQAHLTALSNEGSVEESEGIFDPVFFGDLTYSYSERENAGGFLAGGISNTHVRQWTANQGLRQTLITGGTVSVSLQENYAEDNLPVGFFGFNPQSDVNFNVNVTQPLLRGGWTTVTTSGIRNAELIYDRDMAFLRQTSLDTLQAAVDAYWDLAFAREDVVVKQFSLELARELRDVTEAKFRVGAAAEVEVVQTEADIAIRETDLLTAQNLEQVRSDILRALIFKQEELEEWNFLLIPSSEPPNPDRIQLDWEQALEAGRMYRGDLRQLRVELEQARLNWEVARQNQLPQLDLVANVNSASTRDQIGNAIGPAFDFTAAGYSVGLTFEVPIGNRQFRGAERRARTLYHLAHRRLRDQEHAIAAEVREAIRNLNFQADRVTIAVRAREVSERQLEAERRRLKEGASTNFRVLEFQEDLVRTLTNEKNARLEYAKAFTKLNTVQGLNWDGSAPELPKLQDYVPNDSPRDGDSHWPYR